jgi:hypothetical protein
MSQRASSLAKAGSRRLSFLPRTETFEYDADDTESSASLASPLARAPSASVRYAWTGDQQVRAMHALRACWAGWASEHRLTHLLAAQVDHEAFHRMTQEHAEAKRSQKELELKVKQ